MDLRAIGFNYNLIDGTTYLEARKQGRKRKVEAAKEQSRPQDINTSIANKDKGRVVMYLFEFVQIFLMVMVLVVLSYVD